MTNRELTDEYTVLERRNDQLRAANRVLKHRIGIATLSHDHMRENIDRLQKLLHKGITP